MAWRAVREAGVNPTRVPPARRTRPRMLPIALGLVGVVACADDPESGRPSQNSTAATRPMEAEETAGSPDPAADSFALPISERLVVFFEASAEEIERARSGVSEEDFHVIVDDLMFYRAVAQEVIEARQLPYVRLEGRRPLPFRVNGVVREYDFPEVTTLDALVLFEPGREPRAIAPLEVDQVDDYFGDPPLP